MMCYSLTELCLEIKASIMPRVRQGAKKAGGKNCSYGLIICNNCFYLKIRLAVKVLLKQFPAG